MAACRGALIVNPQASRVTPELTVAVERELRPAGELRDAAHRAATARRRPGAAAWGAAYERLYVFGGDGAFNEVVNGVEDDVAVGFVPGRRHQRAAARARAAARPGRSAPGSLPARSAERRISLGRVNGRRFTFSAGVGLDAELVRRVDELGRANGKRAGDLAFVRTLAGMLAAPAAGASSRR